MQRMEVQYRDNIKPGMKVSIIQEHHLHTGELTVGIVSEVLSTSAMNPHGIKVLLETGEVGRVQVILGDS